jgi:hypothetical protein
MITFNKKIKAEKKFLFFIFFSTFFSSAVLFGQNIPISSNTLTVYPSTYPAALHALRKMGYKISSEDKDKGLMQTDFKTCSGTICHISIHVQISRDSAQITGRWWTETAPPAPGSNKNIGVVSHVDSQMDVLFEELLKYAKALQGSSIRYSTTAIVQ